MTTKLTRHEQRRRDAFGASLASLDDARDRLSEEVYMTLLTRASIPTNPDGYPARSGFDGTGASGHSDHSSVEAAVLARAKGRRDTLVEVTRLVEWSVREAAHILNAAQAAISYTFQVEEEMQGRQAGAPCLVCGVNPAASAGYCADDYRLWQQHGRPDRLRWQLYKTEQRNSEGEVLVSECPPPSSGCRAQVGPHSAGGDFDGD